MLQARDREWYASVLDSIKAEELTFHSMSCLEEAHVLA